LFPSHHYVPSDFLCKTKVPVRLTRSNKKPDKGIFVSNALLGGLRLANKQGYNILENKPLEWGGGGGGVLDLIITIPR
jgi:hypothetical protein